MHLTADTFLEIVGSLRSDAGCTAMREQRKAPRVGVRGRATIMITPQTSPKVVSVNVRDISAAGIGLLVPEPGLDEGHEFLLLLPKGIRHPKRAVSCTVQRFTQLAESLFSVGAILGNEVPAELVPVVAPSAASPGAAAPTAMPVARLAAMPPPPPRRSATVPAAPARAAHAPTSPVLPIASAPSAIPLDLVQGADARVIDELEARLRAISE
jgi:hypothetical protein